MTRFKAWLMQLEGLLPDYPYPGRLGRMAHRDAEEGRPGAFQGGPIGGDPHYRKEKKMKGRKSKSRRSKD